MDTDRYQQCQLTEEESLLNQMIIASIPLPKFHPRLAEMELETVLYGEREPCQQQLGAQDVRTLLSDMMLAYVEKGFDTSKMIVGETMLNFALKYRLTDKVVATLLDHGAPAQTPDSQGFTPFRITVLDLPYSKLSLLRLLEGGIDMTREETISPGELHRHPLTLMCSRSADTQSAQIIATFLKIPGAIPRRSAESSVYSRYKDILQESFSTAVLKRAHPKVVNALMANGASPFRSAIVGKAVIGGNPEVLKVFLDGGVSVEPLDGLHGMNPLFLSIWNAMETCKNHFSIGQVLKNKHFRCMCLLLAKGCYVNEIHCEGDSARHVYEYWETDEGILRGYDQPEFFSAMCAFYTVPTHAGCVMNRCPRELTSYMQASEINYPSIYFLLLALEKLIDAGALPNKGELPIDITEWIFEVLVESVEQFQEAAEIVFNKLHAAGFEVFSYDFVERYEARQTELRPEWTIPSDEAELLEKFEGYNSQPKTLLQSSVIAMRRVVAHHELRDDLENPVPFEVKLEDAFGFLPRLIKDTICLKDLKSLSDHWKEDIQQSC